MNQSHTVSQRVLDTAKRWSEKMTTDSRVYLQSYRQAHDTGQLGVLVCHVLDTVRDVERRTGTTVRAVRLELEDDHTDAWYWMVGAVLDDDLGEIATDTDDLGHGTHLFDLRGALERNGLPFTDQDREHLVLAVGDCIRWTEALFGWADGPDEDDEDDKNEERA